MTSPTLTRRALIAGAGTAVASAALVVPYVAASRAGESPSAAAMTTEGRKAYHLAEYKRACEELDPMIGHWSVWTDEDTGNQHVCAFHLTGRYEGDGIYESGKENVFGNRGLWSVTIQPTLIDGQRTFSVSCPGERLLLIESRLETFIGRRLA